MGISVAMKTLPLDDGNVKREPNMSDPRVQKPPLATSHRRRVATAEGPRSWYPNGTEGRKTYGTHEARIASGGGPFRLY